MKKTALILLLALFHTACFKSNEKSKITTADWLPGNWENKSKEGDFIENWTKVNDSIYNGESFFIKGKDTLHFEKIQLIQKKEDLLYISTIKGQNNDKPITFIKKDTVAKQLFFENPNNDYPKKITYNPISSTVIIIEISGIQQGKPSFTTYNLKKNK